MIRNSIYAAGLVVLLAVIATCGTIALQKVRNVNCLQAAGVAVEYDPIGRATEASPVLHPAAPVLGRLARAEITDEEISESTVSDLANAGSLSTLLVFRCQFSRASLARLGELGELENLSLSECNLSDNDLRHIVRLGRLRTIDLSGNPLTDDVCPLLASVASLERIDLSDTLITDAGVAVLCGMLPSAELQATLQDGLRGEGLAPASNRLRMLALSGTSITDAVVEHLSQCAVLESLDLSWTACGDDGMVYLTRLRHLSRLRLDGTRVSDAGVGALRDCDSLRYVSLRDTGVGERGLRNLLMSPNLSTVVCVGTEVDASSATALRELVPSVSILAGDMVVH